MTTANTTGSKLASLNASFAAADANQGHGSLGVWPEEPNSKEHILTIRGMTVKEDAKFRYKAGPNAPAGAKPIERDALEVQFLYSLMNPDTGVDQEFKGAPMTIPFNRANLPDNQLTRVRMAEERLKGSLKGLAGDNFVDGDLESNLNFATNLIASAAEQSSFVQAKVYLNFSPQKDKANAFNKEEFIRELLAS